MPPDVTRPADGGFVRALGVRELAANGTNLIIGASIFVLPAAVAAVLGPASIVAYVVCAIAVALVALCFAEAGSRVVVTGGIYAYVEAAFGPFPGFLTGGLFLVGCQMTASAAVAVALVSSIAQLVPATSGAGARAAMLVALYAALALVNVVGVRAGARLIEVATVAKLGPLLLLIVAGFFAAQPGNLAWDHMPSLQDIGRASLVLVFAFMGFEGALTPSGEVRDPPRTVPRAILLALGGVALLYGSVQLVAQGVLGTALSENSVAPLAAVAERSVGGWGRALMLVGAIVSTFGYVAGDMLATPRLVYTFGRDRFLPAFLGAIHPRFRTPHIAITGYGAACCAFALTGTFQALLVLSVVATLCVYLACCLAALELRRRDVRADGPPFRAPGGPVAPVLAAGVVVWLLSNATRREFVAVGVMLAIASLLYALRRHRAPVLGDAAAG